MYIYQVHACIIMIEDISWREGEAVGTGVWVWREGEKGSRKIILLSLHEEGGGGNEDDKRRGRERCFFFVVVLLLLLVWSILID